MLSLLVVCGVTIPLTGSAFDTSEDDLVGWWTLDETSGVRYDSSANENDLTDFNSVGYTTGVSSNASDFTSASTETLEQTSLSGASSGSAEWSLSYWWKGSTASVPVEWGTSGSLTRYEVYHPANQLALLLNGGNIYWTTTILDDGNWHHVVITHAGGQVNYTNTLAYVDNVALTYASQSAQTPNISVTPSFCIGASCLDNGFYVDDVVDEVNLWSAVLTSDDRTELYASSTYSDIFGVESTTTATTTITTSSIDVSELTWMIEMYLSWFTFLLMTLIGYKVTKFVI